MRTLNTLTSHTHTHIYIYIHTYTDTNTHTQTQTLIYTIHIHTHISIVSTNLITYYSPNDKTFFTVSVFLIHLLNNILKLLTKILP